MVFTKDDLAIVVTCFTEKGSTGTLNPLDNFIWDILKELKLPTKEGMNCLQTSKIVKVLSETNGIMLMIRE